MKKKRKPYFTSNLAKLTIIVGAVELVPLFLLPFYPSEIKFAPAFLVPGLGSFFLAFIINFVVKKFFPSGIAYTKHHWTLLVLYVWFYSALMGAVPFLIATDLTFVQSVFESVSGWTTTGYTVVDVTAVPTLILFYRACTHFSGGLGFVVIVCAFVQDRNSMSLFSMEGHPDKTMPSIKETARSICAVYLSCFAIGTAAYTVCGMPLIDSMMHTMSALSTGGFSCKPGSIGDYNSRPIEAVSIALMLIGTTNFALLLLASKGKIKDFLRAGENRLLAVILICGALTGAAVLSVKTGVSYGEGIRQTLFILVSAISTTGFSIGPYANFPPFIIGMIIIVMLIGGGVGSTAAGIKLSRVLIALKSARYYLKRKISSGREINKPYYYRAQGKTVINSELATETFGHIACYLVIVFVGALLITLTASCSFQEALFDFISSMGVGLSLGVTGPHTNSATLIVEICGMLLGRLEIAILITGIFSAFNLVSTKVLQHRRRKRHLAKLALKNKNRQNAEENI